MNRDRIAKLLPRLASDHDGEVVATVAALRRTLAADGDDLHVLAELVAETRTDDEWEEAYREQVEHNAKIFAQASALRDRVRDLEWALAEANKGAAKPLATPRARKSTTSDGALAEAIRDRDASGERLRAATEEIARLRAEVADLIGRPRGTLPPSFERFSPIERVAMLEAWVADEGLSQSDRRWARRLLEALEAGKEVDTRDAKRFTAMVRRI